MFCVREAFSLLGFTLDPEKSQLPAAVAHILGVVLNAESLATQRLLRVEAKPTRLANFHVLTNRILETGCLTPSLAASLLGKFGFLCSTLFGKLGRCCTAAIRERQYASSADTSLTLPIRQCLYLKRHLLYVSPPRQFRFGSCQPPLLLYTDASDVPERDDRFIVGGVLVDPQRGPALEYFSWVVPPAVVSSWLPKKSYMGQLEIFAGPVALATWASQLRHRDVLHFVDNDAAAACLVKGYSPKLDSSALVGEHWSHAADAAVNLYIDRVESKSNIADGPSRQDFALMETLRARPCSPVVSLGHVSPCSFPGEVTTLPLV